jgi:hypothetical protein
VPQPPGYVGRERFRDRSTRKGSDGIKRSPLTPDPILDEDVPVVLNPGAHGPADQLRFSDLSRGAVRRLVIFFGPPRHDSWPHDVDRTIAIQRALEGNRPADAKLIRRRQYPHPSQTARPRTDVPQASEDTQIIEGSF